MTNRREFIRRGIAASTIPAIAGAVFDSDHRRELYLHRPAMAVVDERFAQSGSYIHLFRQFDVPVYPIRGDVTDVWYDDLYHRWKNPGVIVVGYTSESSLFCLEQLAWKADRRVGFRAHHVRRSPEAVEHTVSGPAALLTDYHSSADIRHWPTWMARLVMHYPTGPSAQSPVEFRVVGAAGDDSSDWDEPRDTWVIAGRRQI